MFLSNKKYKFDVNRVFLEVHLLKFNNDPLFLCVYICPDSGDKLSF